MTQNDLNDEMTSMTQNDLNDEMTSMTQNDLNDEMTSMTQNDLNAHQCLKCLNPVMTIAILRWSQASTESWSFMEPPG